MGEEGGRVGRSWAGEAVRGAAGQEIMTKLFVHYLGT